jgi:glycosyltransferase involved in cell wall biosynthesis
MRPDKGLDRLPDVISHIPDNVRARISIAFAGQGDCADIIAKLKTLVPVARSPEARRLSDLEIARELARSDILLAPYPLVSASGTVVLALCRGLGVIAYDTGALADVINSDGLVPLGNEREFALRIEAALKADVGRPKHSLDAWRDSSLAAWLEAIGL